jgi:hypothetical protein
MRRIALSVIATITLTAGTLAAQQLEPLTSVSLYKVKPDKADSWNGAFKKHFVPMLDKLMTDGTVIGYGLDMDVLHQPGETNTTVWFTVANFAGYGRVLDMIGKTWEKVGVAERQTLLSYTDPDKHRDFLMRSIVVNSKTPPPGVMPYTHVSRSQVKPGKSEDFRKLFDKYSKPVYDQLIADGTLLYYSLDVEEIHSEDMGMRWVVSVAADLAAADKINAAFDAAREKMSAAERSTIGGEYREVLVPGVHRDFLMHAAVFASK